MLTLSLDQAETEPPEAREYKKAGIDQTETLRQILAKQQHRLVDYDDAREVGDSLLVFYTVLAEELSNE